MLQQEQITRSKQLPYLAYVSGFPQTGLYLDTFWSTFSRENVSSASSRSKSKYKMCKRKKKVKNGIFRSIGFADQFVRLEGIFKFARKLF